MNLPKYSIVIPTYNHLEDCLRPCIESIIKYTDLSTTEVIVVANGCIDGTKDYLATLPQEHFKTVWLDAPSGYTFSTNRGIEVAKGEYIILLNNDTILLSQTTNSWIDMLEAPFKRDSKTAITGPMNNWCPHSERNFMIFFCVMIPRTIFDKFGLMDEIYNPGFGEDTDYSIVVQNAGYKIVQVPSTDPLAADMIQERMVSNFPIYHAGESTLGVLPGGEELLTKNRKILEARWKGKAPKLESILQEVKDPYAHLTKLNLGCGDTLLNGYVNADLYNPAAQVKADAFNLPFEDGRFEEIFACHVFEHLNPYKAKEILVGWSRVLQPGGKLVMEMPDILEICKNFEQSTKNERFRLLNCIYGTTQIEHPHVFGWYPDILKDELVAAGYTDIVFMPAKVYHWGFNFRVECKKAGNIPLPKKDIVEVNPLPKTEAQMNPFNVLPDGYFTDQDIDIYRNLVDQIPDGSTIAELGCWKGKSLCSIADIILKKNLKVLAVDTWQGTDNVLETILAVEAKTYNIRQEFENNIEAFGISKNVTLMQMTTTEASKILEKDTLDFVFVDADHRYECVKDDVYNWMPLLKNGRTIAGHDASWHTVYTAVGEIFDNSKVYRVAELWWAEKIQKTGKVYDCITFFNELDILEIRMNELDPVVDHFVIVEATTTHTGMPKILYFEENKERFAKFADKIIHIVVQLPKEGDTWTRERAQRDYIGDVLKAKCVSGDTVIISDADEIPRMETVRDYRNVHGPKQFEQQLHYYSLNNKCINDTPWNWSKILPYDLYMSCNMTPCMVRYSQFAALKDAGWHFSFIGNVEFIKKKISSWAHNEFNTPEINNDINISTSIKNGKDIFGRHIVFETVTIDATYPKFIQNNIATLVEKELLRG